MNSNSQNDIAVIGIGCRFPDADRGDIFYHNLIEQRDSVTEIPKERWDVQSWYSKNKADNRIASMWGGFINGVDQFDARFFKIIPSEAEQLDPQQKLFLTCSWEALEDAGYVSKASHKNLQVGVYAGVTWNEFSLLANEYGYLNDTYRGAGSLYWGIPNRVSYFFDFKGPSISVDTACSSSLVAIDIAIQGLLNNDTDMALAGAVNLNLHPAKYLFLSSANFLSSEGKCRGFGEGGDGYVPSEGVAVIVLKRLQDAVASGDRIYGVIKGIATNHGGKATGYTVPNPMAHKAVIEAALNKAKVKADEISYVECHGTGTDLGDPIEIAGLKLAYQQSTDKKQFCAIGTVKSNIGHCEATAGVAGLVKILYSMQHKMLPATLHAQQPNKKIDFANSPFYLVTENQTWQNEAGELIAGLSSFGAGGTNSHCIIASYTAPQAHQILPAELIAEIMPLVVPVSATNEERAKAYCQELLTFLTNRKVNLINLSYTLTRRESFEYRVAFIVNTQQELQAQLQAFLQSTGSQQKVFSENLQEPVPTPVQNWLDNSISVAALQPQNCPATLIDLPKYCFEPRRSWLHEYSGLYEKTHNESAHQIISRIHPLIDSNCSNVNKGIFKKRLSRTEYYVDEHWIQENPVLPGVCLVEMSMSAARIYLNNEQVQAHDVWFLEPVNLRENAFIDLQIEVSLQGTDYRFEVFSQAGEVKHVTGKIKTPNPAIDSSDALAKTVEPSELATLKAACSNQLTEEQIYQNFGITRIVQLARFKVVKDYVYNETLAVARLKLDDWFVDSDTDGFNNSYGLNPTLLDGAVQTAMSHLFIRQGKQGTVLPFQMGACIRFARLQPFVNVIAQLKNAESKKYDIQIIDDNGICLARINDFVLRVYQDKSLDNNVLLFNQQPVAVEKIKQKDANNAAPGRPVCTLLTKSGEFTDLNTPQYWRKIIWDASLDENLESTSRELIQWLESAVHATPRILLTIDDLATHQVEALGDLNSAYQTVIEYHAQRLFNLAKLLAGTNINCEVIVVVAAGTPVANLISHAVKALLMTLNQEMNRVRYRMLDIETAQLEEPIESILRQECEQLANQLYIRYARAQRFYLENSPVTIESANQTDVKHWIVTGAGGALGQLTTEMLLNKGYSVIMLGRSPQSSAHQQRFSAYTKNDAAARECSAVYVQCDLTRESNPPEALQSILSSDSWQQANIGIVHCAGIVADATIMNKNWQGFASVMQAKVKTLFNLFTMLDSNLIKQLVLFSSITSLMGNRGQSDYAFANGLLDGMQQLVAQFHAQRSIQKTTQASNSSTLNVACLCWPYWQDGGMKISEEHLPGYINHFLTHPLPNENGIALLEQAITAKSFHAGVLYSNTSIDVLNGRMALKPMPASVEAKTSRAQSDLERTTNNSGADVSYAEQAENAQVASFDEIKNYLFWLFASNLKLDLNDDDLELELSDLGLDSIAQMDLITQIEKENRFGSISQTLLLDYPTLANLIEFFQQNYPSANYALETADV
ncbi:SDR family NAD(P)-dependent oxidoreductase [Aliikangiella maris]|uniref:SDR family NAD(P)-dependent oxidoreductase n=2 Tax=Aliikangiella maris TaxID=3162458 RepID=A0ABV2BTX4_9GAMM